MYNVTDNIRNDKDNLTITAREIRQRVVKDSSCLSGYATQNIRFYKCTCHNCGWDECYIDEYALKRGRGCSCCHGRTVVEGINDIPTTEAWMIDYFQHGYDEAKLYTKGSKNKITPICPDCKTIKDRPISIYSIYKNRSVGCLCGDGISYPNKFSYFLLKQLGDQICSYEREFSPEWCEYEFNGKVRKGRYDNKFIIKSNNQKCILEMDGEFHTFNRFGKRLLKRTQYADKVKDDLALKNGYYVIRIDCMESNLKYIRNNILNCELSKILDLNDVNWEACNEYAMSNLSKKVIEYYNQFDTNIPTISEVFDLSRHTVLKYLKNGAKSKLCDYNPIKAKSKSSRKNGIYVGKLNGCKVEVFQACVSLGVYESAAQIQRLSLEKFGVKLYSSAINACCREGYGKDNIYKGFTFKRVE